MDFFWDKVSKEEARAETPGGNPGANWGGGKGCKKKKTTRSERKLSHSPRKKKVVVTLSRSAGESGVGWRGSREKRASEKSDAGA